MAKKITAFLLFILLGTTVGGVVSAVTVEPIPTGYGSIVTGITSGSAFVDLIDGITDWLFVFLVVAATIFIVLAGWQFVTSGGDPQAMSQARSKLMYAAVGIIVALLSRGLVTAISNLIS